MSSYDMRVMSYNICRYNFDQGPKGLPAEIFDEKTTNLKEMFMEYGPDLIGLQEDWKYVDAAEKKQAGSFLFKPVWRFTAGTTECTLRAKYAAVAGSHSLVAFSTGRFYRKALFTHLPSRKKILFISCHPTPYAQNEAKRRIEYTELFQCVNSETWDWCVITGDFNTNTDADRKLLKSMCGDQGFTMAIGGYLPWVATCLGHSGEERYSFDNILVSNKITFKRIKVLREWYDRLYSDHVPVVADVVLK